MGIAFLHLSAAFAINYAVKSFFFMFVYLFLLFDAGKELEVMKEKGERAEELEVQLHKLERDNESLQKKVASLEITCEKVRRL